MNTLPEITLTKEQLEQMDKRQKETRTLLIPLTEDLNWIGDIDTFDSVIVYESLILLKHLAPYLVVKEKDLMAKIRAERRFKKNEYEHWKKEVEKLEKEILKTPANVIKLYNEFKDKMNELQKKFPDDYWYVIDYSHVVNNLQKAKYELMARNIY